MNRAFHELVQVAGVHDVDEALMLAALGVDAVGIPLRLPVHVPDVDEDGAETIFKALKGKALRVLITYEQDPEEIVLLASRIHADCVQLHGEWDGDPSAAARSMSRVRQLSPGLLVIKSLIIRSGMDSTIAAARMLWDSCDAFLTDTYDPATGATGATGKPHDWSLSRELVLASPVPVILAGGLGPDNAARAIEQVMPAGVDAHTGLEEPGGRKSATLVRDFVERAKLAFARYCTPGP